MLQKQTSNNDVPTFEHRNISSISTPHVSLVSHVLDAVGHVLQGSLAVATQMLMSEEAYTVPGLRAGLGRLANSVVAVLGPELSPGTDVYAKCKALIREIQVVLNACRCR